MVSAGFLFHFTKSKNELILLSATFKSQDCLLSWLLLRVWVLWKINSKNSSCFQFIILLQVFDDRMSVHLHGAKLDV